MSRIAFLGGGRITTALVSGLRAARFAHRIVAYDRSAAKMRALERQFRVETAESMEAALRKSDLLVVAVRPQSLPELLPSLRPEKPVAAVSLAAGVPVQSLRALADEKIQWARAMPSPACRTGRGLTAVLFPSQYPVAAKMLVTNMFAAVGQVVTVREAQFDAFTVLYSTSHGQHALRALAEAGRKLGLDARVAQIAAAHALAGGIALWRESGLSLEEELREAATPGGIAAEVMRGMDSAGYQRAVERGLRAGMAQARALARQQRPRRHA
jgi:pyrroline-5-carboxylate reductase